MNPPACAVAGAAGFALTGGIESRRHVLRPGRQASRMRPARTGVRWPARRHPVRGHRSGRLLAAVAPYEAAARARAHPVPHTPGQSTNPGRSGASPALTWRPTSAGTPWACPGVRVVASGAVLSGGRAGGGSHRGRRAWPVQRIRLDRAGRGERRWGRSRAGARQPGGHPARGCPPVLGPARGTTQSPASAACTATPFTWGRRGWSGCIDRPVCSRGEGRR